VNPKSVSASALHVAELCPARYQAENINYSKGFGGTAANLGTAVHGALELYVKRVYLEKAEDQSLKLLLDFFSLSYIDTFGTYDTSTIEYMEGRDMLEKWFGRTEIVEGQVISCEIKDHFDVPTTLGPLPFNYVWDRFDQTGPKEFTVVDYKTNRWGIRPEDLKKKIQARAYALAAAIQLKDQGQDYNRIWVKYDMLRHDGLVGVVFSREEMASTWSYIKRTVQGIIDTPPDEAEERLNPECLFCVRKAECKTLLKNIVVGGIHSIGSIEEAIDLRSQLEYQKKGVESLLKDLDQKILTEARERDMEEFESDTNLLRITVPRRRAVDADMVEAAIGPKLFDKYGSHSITMASVEKLLKGRELTAEQKSQLKSLIYNKTGEPAVKVEAKNPYEED
jgi:hypothetical protein